MKSILQFILKILAKLYIWRYKPKVIGVTGSVGKTTAKTAIDLILNGNFNFRSSQKSYNNQFGLPLTILGYKTAGRNFFGWLAIIFGSLGKLFFDKNHPSILVLEMGSDRIGDLQYLTSIVKPNISVIMSVGIAHTAALGDLENVAKEKVILVKVLPANGWAVLNYDDARVKAMANHTQAKKVFFGLNHNVDVAADNIQFKNGSLNFDLKTDSRAFHFSFKDMGKHLIYPLIAAFSVGKILKIDPHKMVTALSHFKPLAGRGKILKGKNNNLIIDETYNSSPLSAQVALDFLRDFETEQKKIAILGDMKELGEQSLASHQALAEQVRFADMVILVGPEIIATYNILKNQHPNIYYFEDVNSLKEKLGSLIKSDNLILIKGSQAVRLEKIVEKLIASHYNKEATLVRQSGEWKKTNN